MYVYYIEKAEKGIEPLTSDHESDDLPLIYSVRTRRVMGLEPTTLSTTNTCSNQLSYTRKKERTGFEPAERISLSAFQADALDHSAISQMVYLYLIRRNIKLHIHVVV